MINDFENRLNQIKRFIRNQMPPDEYLEFKSQTEADPELRKLVEDVALIDSGLVLADQIKSTHIDAADLALYAEDKGTLDYDKIREVEIHLTTCHECRDELQACHRSVSTIQTYSPDRKSIIKRLFAFVHVDLPPKPALNIVMAGLALITVVLLSVPVYHIARDSLSEKQTLVCRLTPSTRDTGQANVFTLSRQIDSLRIELDFPAPDNRNLKYSVYIYDATENKMIEKHGLIREKLIAIVLPAEYFDSEVYRVVVEERLDNMVRREIVFPLALQKDK